MRKIFLLLIPLFLISCITEELEEDPPRFYVQKHNIKQINGQNLYNHEVYIKIENLYSDFSINGIILKSENISIISKHQYSVVELSYNYAITISGICIDETMVTIKYTSNKKDLININNFILSYNNELIALDKSKKINK